ncbi:MAG: DUF2786 domain-containing protein [Polyangiaceae bacterium]|nr:DUF2786 domain-containing protein [Polyangiaceae bacterium]
MTEGEITARQRTSALRALARQWSTLNWSVFGEAMKAPTFELSTAEGQLGGYRPAYRSISISERLVFGQPWLVVVEVLKHEMAHQYVSEVLKVSDETAHGAAFADVCRRFSIDARAAGMPEVEQEEERLRERVARLLALAESPNQHEAEAAMRAAQRLMLKHNLDTAGARRDYVWKTLGTPTARVQEPDRYLATILCRHFFVEAIWAAVYDAAAERRKSVLEVCGTSSNVALAEYVYAFLRETAERLWRAHKRAHGLAFDRERRRFLSGVMLGFSEKLKAEQRESEQAGLVWQADADLQAYYRGRHPRVSTVTFGRSGPSLAHAHGRVAGRGIELHRPVGAGSPSGPRLLGPRR